MNSDTSINLQYVFEATRDRVFQAWSDPTLAQTWLPVVGDAEIVTAHANAVTKGDYSYSMLVEGLGELVMCGVFTEVAPPSRLVFTLTFEDLENMDPFPRTTVAVTLNQFDDRTQLLLEHDGLHADMAPSVARRWSHAIKRLAHQLRQGQVLPHAS